MQRQTVQTPRRDIKIAPLSGKEAREVWKALGKDGWVYNTEGYEDRFSIYKSAWREAREELPYQMNEQKLEVIVTDNSINIIHRF